MLVVAALVAGGAGGFALARATDESATTTTPILPAGGEEVSVRGTTVPKKLRQRCAIPVPNRNFPLDRAIRRALPSLPPRCRKLLPGPPPPLPTTTEAPSTLRQALKEGRIHEDQDPETYPPDVKRAIREYEAQKAQ